ncbi:uncharacterized protein LOC144445286 [Glandiceps talaboti]
MASISNSSHLDDNSTTAVLFVFDSWDVDVVGLQGFHRTLVKDLVLRKNNTDLKVYSTVLDTVITDKTATETKSLNITLISPNSEKIRKMKLEDNIPKRDWLVHHKSFYPGLSTLKNIEYVVGYAPKTADAACIIKDDLFSNATLVLINHVLPDSECFPSSMDELGKLEDDMFEWAHKADMIFSIGPHMFHHFNDTVYRADNLYEKPHKEYLPRPDNTFFQNKAVLQHIPKNHLVFSYGKIESNDELEKAYVIAAAMGEVSDTYKKSKAHPPAWMIQGFQKGINITLFTETLTALDVRHSLYNDLSLKRIARHLQQSHLCIVTNCYKEYSFDGLEAMAIGLPLLTPAYSHIAIYIDEYFTDHEDDCVVSNPRKDWPGRITKKLSEKKIRNAFKKAKELRTIFRESTSVAENHSKFAAIFKAQSTSVYTQCALKDNCTEDLSITVKVEERPYHEMSKEYRQEYQHCQLQETEESKEQCKTNSKLKEEQVKKTLQCVDKSLEKHSNIFKQDPNNQKRLNNSCNKNYANVKDVGKGCLLLILNFTSLLHLYKFEGKCRSGQFSAAIEPLLISDEMIEISSKLNITPQLRVEYDQDNFKAVERYFMLRDGGLRGENESIYDNEVSGEEIHVNTDEVYLIARYDGIWKPEVKLNWKTLITSDGEEGLTSYLYGEEIWASWFFEWIDLLYVMNIIFVIVITVTLIPSFKTAFTKDDPCSIEVTAHKTGITKDDLSLYFESKRKSKGGPVKNVEMKDARTFVITFENVTAAQSVLHHGNHTLNSIKLTVKPFETPSMVKTEEMQEDSEEEPNCTIEVTGFKPDTSANTLEFYFKNKKRSSGGSLANSNLNNGVFTATFETPDICESVLRQTEHVIQGAILTVKKKKKLNLPRDGTGFLLRGLADTTSRETLQLFLEICTGITKEIPELFFGERPGTVMVKYSEEIQDFENIKRCISKRKLSNAKLAIEPVYHTNCILVTNLPINVSEDTVELYFESTKRSGGGEIQELEMNVETNTALVYFEDYTVVDQVLRRTHKINKVVVEVQPFIECLGHVVSREEPTARIPDSTSLDVNVNIIKFIMSKEDLAFELKQTTEAAFAQLVWSHEGKGDTVLLIPDIAEHMKSKDQEVKDWTNSVKDAVYSYLRNFKTVEVPVLEGIWLQVISQKSGWEMENVDVQEDEMSPAIIMTGKSEDVKTVQRRLEILMKDIENEMTRAKRRVEDSAKLDELKIKQLLMIKFPRTAEKQSPDLKVKVVAKSHQVKFEGLPNDVMTAKCLMFETLDKTPSTTFKAPTKSLHDFLKSSAVSTQLHELFKKRDIQATYLVGEGEIICSAVDTKDLKVATEVIQRSVREERIPIQPQCAPVLQMKEWNDLTTQQEETHLVHIGQVHQHSYPSVTVTGFDESVSTVVGELQDFIKSSVTMENEMQDDSEEEPNCTIEVTGFKPDTSTDTLELYFESRKRSSGSNLTNSNLNNGVFTATFETPDICERVLRQTKHVIQGAILTVKEPAKKKKKPNLPRDGTSFLLRGLTDRTSRETLELYLENCTGIEKETPELFFGEGPGTVMVKYSEEIQDFESIKRYISKRKLSNAKLAIEPVHHTNCILVTNLPLNVSEDTVALYFESTKRSGGGEIRELEMNVETNTALVYFEDYTVVDQVLRRTHKINKAVVEVQPFIYNLGHVVSREEPTARIPDSTTIDVDVNIMKFIMSKEDLASDMKQTTAAAYAQMEWSHEGKGDTLLVIPDIPKLMKNRYQVVKDWTNSVKDAVYGYLRNFKTVEVPVLEGIWLQVISQKSGWEMENVDVQEDEMSSAFIVTGKSEDVKMVQSKLEILVKDIENKMQRAKRSVEDSVKLDELKIKQLQMTKFPRTAEEQFPDLKVKVVAKSHQVKFEGLPNDVMTAKCLMFETVDKTPRTTYKAPTKSLHYFLKSSAVSSQFHELFKKRQIQATYFVGEEEIICSAVDKNDLKVATEVIQRRVREERIPIQPQCSPVLQMKEWNDLISQEEEMHLVRIGQVHQHGNPSVTVSGFDESVSTVVGELQDFIKLNTIIEHSVKMENGKARYIFDVRKSDIDRIEKQGKRVPLQIVKYPKGTSTVIVIKGTEDDVKEGDHLLQQLLDDVHGHPYLVEKPGMARFFQEEKGQNFLSVVERNHNCRIDLNDPSDYDILCFHSLPDGRRIIVGKGDLTKMHVDAIVNSANPKLDHSPGGLAKAISDAGGPNIQQESDDLIKKGGRLSKGQAVYTGPGNLPCKVIIHTVGPTWNKHYSQKLDTYGERKSQEERLLADVVRNSLKMVERMGHTSVAVPAISSGASGFPLDLCTQTIIEAIDGYCRDNATQSLKEIRLADYSDITCQKFQDAMIKRFGANKVTVTRRDEKGYASEEFAAAGGITTSSNPLEIKITEGKKIRLVKGNIAQQKASVIVNTTQTSLDLNTGAVSKTLLQVAGPQLQQLVSQQGSMVSPMEGGIIITGGAGLKCDKVYHVLCCKWDGGRKSEPLFRGIMKKCFDTADQEHVTSIVFPAVGTGGLNFPKDFTARVMYEEAIYFCRKNPRSSVSDIRFVVYDKDMRTTKAFEDIISRLTGTTSSLSSTGCQTLPPQSFTESTNTRQSQFYAEDEDTGATAAAPSNSFSSKRAMGSAIETNANQKLEQEVAHGPVPVKDKGDTVILYIFAGSEKDIKGATTQIEKMIADEFTDYMIREDTVSKIPDNEMPRLMAYAEGLHVKLEKVFTGSVARLRLRGSSQAVMKVQREVDMVRDKIIDDERRMLLRNVKWLYLNDKATYEEYEDEVMGFIEKAYLDDKRSITVDIEDVKYLIDFSDMTEVDMGDGTKVSVRRELKEGGFPLPDHWRKMAETEQMKRVVLDAQSNEFKTVATTFIQTLRSPNVVQQIERIQNPKLYRQYMVLKQNMDRKNKKGINNEKLLYHGTGVDSVDKINHGGFNRIYGKNATDYGAGSYFAVNSSYSASTTYSPPDPTTGNRYVYQAKVLTGEFTRGQQGMLVPPSKSGSDPTDCYDSVTDNVQNPSLFVVFNDVMAYPDYLITFR